MDKENAEFKEVAAIGFSINFYTVHCFWSRICQFFEHYLPRACHTCTDVGGRFFLKYMYMIVLCNDYVSDIELTSEGGPCTSQGQARSRLERADGDTESEQIGDKIKSLEPAMNDSACIHGSRTMANTSTSIFFHNPQGAPRGYEYHAYGSMKIIILPSYYMYSVVCS